jgi:hypothetical protein
VNIKDIYARGGNLNDAWKEPFFHAIRGWQHAYSNSHRNGIAPCRIVTIMMNWNN